MTSYEPEGNLAGSLSTLIEIYEADFEEYWGLRDEAALRDVADEDLALARALDSFGKKLLAGLHELRLRPELVEPLTHWRPGDSPLRTAHEFSSYQIAYDRLEIELATQSVELLFGARKRLFKLLILLSDFAPTERALAYLDRVTRLYLWGFDAEVPILCRATLEAALEERVSENELSSLGMKRGRFGFSVHQYIEAGVQLGILTVEGQALANDIRSSGNAAAHAAPGLSVDSFELVGKLWMLLDHIFKKV